MYAPSIFTLPLLLSLTVLAPAPAAAGAVADTAAAPFTLRDAIARAAAANPDLLRDRASVDAATANVTAALGQFDLQLTGDAGVIRRVIPPINVMDTTAGITDSFSADVGLARA